MMTWLKNKYDNPNTLVRIIKNLKRLPPASSDKASYHNLNQFSMAMNQLKIHQCQNKLDKSTRHDLLRILLVREHLMQFIAEERNFERTLKGDDTDDPNDAASVGSAGNDDEKESERREFYIHRMEHFLSVIRSLYTTISPTTKATKTPTGSRSRGYSSVPSQQSEGQIKEHIHMSVYCVKLFIKTIWVILCYRWLSVQSLKRCLNKQGSIL